MQHPVLNIAVVGAGIMGHGVAQEYATAGFNVSIYALPRARPHVVARMETNLALLVRDGLVTAEQARAAVVRVKVPETMAEAASEADFVVEAVVENLAVKQDVFRELDAICPAHAILATNTSGISITAIASATGRPDKVVGTHYWNPPYLMPLVEVIRGKDTSDDTVATTRALLERVGKTPIVVRKDVPGFLWNRLQFALLREASWLVENGICSVEDVDLVVQKGLGRRLSLMGPFETADFGGLDTFAAIAGYLWKELSCETEPRLVLERTEKGDLGVKSGHGFYDWPEDKARAHRERRDSGLARLLLEDKQGGWGK